MIFDYLNRPFDIANLYLVVVDGNHEYRIVPSKNMMTASNAVEQKTFLLQQLSQFCESCVPGLRLIESRSFSRLLTKLS